MQTKGTVRKEAGNLDTKMRDVYEKVKPNQFNFNELKDEEIQTIGVQPGRRCKMFFHCRQDSALNKLLGFINSGELDKLVETKVNSLLDTKAIRVKFTCSLKKYDRCKRYFARSLDEGYTVFMRTFYVIDLLVIRSYMLMQEQSLNKFFNTHLNSLKVFLNIPLN